MIPICTASQAVTIKPDHTGNAVNTIECLDIFVVRVITGAHNQVLFLVLVLISLLCYGSFLAAVVMA